jgi:hypothetical protein
MKGTSANDLLSDLSLFNVRSWTQECATYSGPNAAGARERWGERQTNPPNMFGGIQLCQLHQRTLALARHQIIRNLANKSGRAHGGPSPFKTQTDNERNRPVLANSICLCCTPPLASAHRTCTTQLFPPIYGNCL